MFRIIFNGIAAIVSLIATFIARGNGDIANEVWYGVLTLLFLMIALHHMQTKS